MRKGGEWGGGGCHCDALKYAAAASVKKLQARSCEASCTHLRGGEGRGERGAMRGVNTLPETCAAARCSA